MKYGPLFRSYIGNYPVVHIMKAQYMEVRFVKLFLNFKWTPFFYRLF